MPAKKQSKDAYLAGIMAKSEPIVISEDATTMPVASWIHLKRDRDGIKVGRMTAQLPGEDDSAFNARAIKLFRELEEMARNL